METANDVQDEEGQMEMDQDFQMQEFHNLEALIRIVRGTATTEDAMFLASGLGLAYQLKQALGMLNIMGVSHD